MTAPMAGFGPMAWSPFPYGPVPSSGTPSGYFVDLFNNQSNILGNKSWNGQQTIQRTTTDTGAETWLSMTDSVDAVTSVHWTSSLGSGWRPLLVASCGGVGGPGLEGRYRVATDSGAVPAYIIDARNTSDGALTVRPMMSIRNAGTEVAGVSAKGAWTYTVLHTDAAAETLATWQLDEDAGVNLQIANGTASNGTFTPRILGSGGSTRSGLEVVGAGAAGGDTGTTPVLVFQARFGTNTSVGTRPCFGWFNRSVSMMEVSAAGGLSISGGNSPSLTVGGPVVFASYTLATLPAAASWTRAQIWVSDMTGGAQFAYSDGTNWRRVSDNTIAS